MIDILQAIFIGAYDTCLTKNSELSTERETDFKKGSTCEFFTLFRFFFGKVAAAYLAGHVKTCKIWRRIKQDKISALKTSV